LIVIQKEGIMTHLERGELPLLSEYDDEQTEKALDCARVGGLVLVTSLYFRHDFRSLRRC
jgi:hypothetical protein